MRDKSVKILVELCARWMNEWMNELLIEIEMIKERERLVDGKGKDGIEFCERG